MPLSNAGTGSSFAALTTNATNPYFAYPFSLAKLPPELEKGLAAPALMGLLSLISSFCLLCFLFSKFFAWKKSAKTYLSYNQYLILFINLLVADFQQALAFVISFHWMQMDSILAPSPACFAQGWFLNIGDVSSGLFVLFIALHTFYTTVVGRRLEYRIFLSLILSTWALALLLTSIGPGIYGRTYFVRTGAWCWVSALYETERLALHYIWIFLVQFSSMITYLCLLVHIKTTVKRTMSIVMANQSQSVTHRKINRAARSMVLYPVFYILLTLPLSAGRMWSLAHHGAFLPNSYLLVAGTLMSSSGFVDACLYALTRRQLMQTDSTKDKGDATPAGGSTLKSRAQSVVHAVVKRPGMARSKTYDVPSTIAHEEKVDQGIRVQHRVSVAVAQGEYLRSQSLATVTAQKTERREKRGSSVAVLPKHGFGEGWRRGSEASEASTGGGSGISVEDRVERAGERMMSIGVVDDSWEQGGDLEKGGAEEREK
ncbi:hypothetical protein CAC42_4407 [Sphaceloma murrayae]|uniref:G protein-coupled receptor GPR1/2/3 C-terminal domain-containing protein n=1 Tax=Sphaceloma murrayae TaxID=2082308 RepID=A0A2K1QLF9_9PEZI|nr:hypothetical protein CAC42_4407 [Sphaceloma murrayae]